MATDINIAGRLHSMATGNVVAGADEILDDALGKKQSEINQEITTELADKVSNSTFNEVVGTGGTVDQRIGIARGELKAEILGGASNSYNTLGKTEEKIKEEALLRENNDEILSQADEALSGRIDTLDTAVGPGGSVEQRIDNAKAEIRGTATFEYNTLGRVEIKIEEEKERAEAAEEVLRDAYEALTESTPFVVGPLDTWPVSNPEEGVIYRVVDRENTPPEYYSDYMWNGTSMVEMARYSNAIDEVPTADSTNLVESGGVVSWSEERYGSYTNNPEFVEVHTDKNDKVLYGVKADGDFYFGAGVPTQVKEVLDDTLSEKVDKEAGKSLIEFNVAAHMSYDDDTGFIETDSFKADSKLGVGDSVTEFKENYEFVEVSVDAENKIIEATDKSGKKSIPFLDIGYSLKLNGYAETPEATYTFSQSQEWISVVIDAQDRIVYGLRVDGSLFCDNLTADNLDDIYNELSEIKSELDELSYLKSSSIFNFNSDTEYNAFMVSAKGRRYDYVHGSYTPAPISLLWFSDIHGDATSLSRIIDWKNKYHAYIDDIISTGDQQSLYFTDSFTWWDQNNGLDILQAIGNHDAWISKEMYQTGDYDDIVDYGFGPYDSATGLYAFYVIKQKPVYDKFFKDRIPYWYVIQPSNAVSDGKNYYYKDYSNRIRLIVLDAKHYGSPDDLDGNSQSIQNAWFTDILSDARLNGLEVVVVSHYYPRVLDQNRCSWSYMSWGASGDDKLNVLATTAVKDFIDAGGTFICWMVGHTHYDDIGLNHVDNNQLVIANATANCSRSNITLRPSGTKLQDSFNIISFNTAEGKVDILKVGDDTNNDFTRRRLLSYQYKDVTDEFGVIHQKGLVFSM